MKILTTIAKTIKRFHRARKMGFTFSRMKSFRTPSHILLSKKRLKVLVPKEEGIAELFRDILLDDEYWLYSIPKDQVKTVLDVGANIGLFSVAARIRFPQSLIHAYEPNIQAQAFLDHQASTFQFKAMYEAIGIDEGWGTLESASGCDTAARVNTHADGNIRITSLTKAIDRLGNQSIDLLKLDCEGYEHEIIDGCGHDGPLKRCRFLSMEYHLGPDMNQDYITNKLRKLNFEIIKASNRNPVIGNILAKSTIN